MDWDGSGGVLNGTRMYWDEVKGHWDILGCTGMGVGGAEEQCVGLGCTGMYWDGCEGMGGTLRWTGKDWGGHWDGLGWVWGVLSGTGMYCKKIKGHWDILGWVWGC